MSWNPRYVAWATAHGNTPEQQIKIDQSNWPGGAMCGFILWIAGLWRTYMTNHKRSYWSPRWPADDYQFDVELAEACAVEAA